MIETERLVLRGWCEADWEPFAAMSRDADVMTYIGPLLDEGEVRAAVARQRAFEATLGYCFWAVERRADHRFLGFCGLKPGPADTPIAGDIEIGWRLARDAWGQGYAREAAAASLAWGWANTDAAGIAAMTVAANVRSWRLMERLGMVRAVHEDFDHPAVAQGDPLRRHIVYRIAKAKP